MDTDLLLSLLKISEVRILPSPLLVNFGKPEDAALSGNMRNLPLGAVKKAGIFPVKDDIENSAVIFQQKIKILDLFFCQASPLKWIWDQNYRQLA